MTNRINVAADVHTVVAKDGDTASAAMTTDVVQPGDTRGDHMADHDEIRDEVRDELTDEELDKEAGEELPDREAMSLINANIAAPVNAAVALNVLSDSSTAIANAEQTATITQST